MNCAQAHQLIHLHVGEDLALPEARLLEAHLQQCVGCRGQQASMHHSMAALHALRDAAPEPAPSVWPAVSSAILSQISRNPGVRRFNLHVTAVSVCSLLLAAATVVQTLDALRPHSEDAAAIWLSDPVNLTRSLTAPTLQNVAAASSDFQLTPFHQTSDAPGWPRGGQDF